MPDCTDTSWRRRAGTVSVLRRFPPPAFTPSRREAHGRCSNHEDPHALDHPSGQGPRGRHGRLPRRAQFELFPCSGAVGDAGYLVLGVEEPPAGTYDEDGDREAVQAGASTGSAKPTRSPESYTALLYIGTADGPCGPGQRSSARASSWRVERRRRQYRHDERRHPGPTRTPRNRDPVNARMGGDTATHNSRVRIMSSVSAFGRPYVAGATARANARRQLRHKKGRRVIDEVAGPAAAADGTRSSPPRR